MWTQAILCHFYGKKKTSLQTCHILPVLSSNATFGKFHVIKPHFAWSEQASHILLLNAMQRRNICQHCVNNPLFPGTGKMWLCSIVAFWPSTGKMCDCCQKTGKMYFSTVQLAKWGMISPQNLAKFGYQTRICHKVADFAKCGLQVKHWDSSITPRPPTTHNPQPYDGDNTSILRDTSHNPQPTKQRMICFACEKLTINYNLSSVSI